MLLHNTLNKLSKNRLSHYIFLTKYANETKGLFYTLKPTTHKRLHPLKRLILYIYTKGLPETPVIQKAYSIYLNQRLTRDSIHSEGLFYISLPKASRGTPPPRLILYIYSKGSQETPGIHSFTHSDIHIPHYEKGVCTLSTYILYQFNICSVSIATSKGINTQWSININGKCTLWTILEIEKGSWNVNCVVIKNFVIILLMWMYPKTELIYQTAVMWKA